MFAKIKFNDTVIHKTALTSYTSHNFRGPQRYPHFRPASDKFWAFHNYPQSQNLLERYTELPASSILTTATVLEQEDKSGNQPKEELIGKKGFGLEVPLSSGKHLFLVPMNNSTQRV